MTISISQGVVEKVATVAIESQLGLSARLVGLPSMFVLQPTFPVRAAVSMGRRNTSWKATCRSFKSQIRSQASIRRKDCPV